MDPLVQAQLEAVCKAEGVILVPLTPSATLGSRQHPSRAGHAVAAAEITEALRKLWAADA